MKKFINYTLLLLNSCGFTPIYIPQKIYYNIISFEKNINNNLTAISK